LCSAPGWVNVAGAPLALPAERDARAPPLAAAASPPAVSSRLRRLGLCLLSCVMCGSLLSYVEMCRLERTTALYAAE
jgi:hypothetical protein